MLKNPKNGITPFCQTIRVVISPNGENAPPALAATTIFIQAKQIMEDGGLVSDDIVISIIKEATGRRRI